MKKFSPNNFSFQFLLPTFISIGLLVSCTNPSSEKKNDSQNLNLITINLQPFSDIPEKQVLFVYNELEKIYPKLVLKKPIPLPEHAFYSPRNRYRADSLIIYLSSITQNGHVTIGLTNKDISYTNDSIPDYGIMGLGFTPGRSCVVSTFRLSKTNTLVQLFKCSVHELGHTQGLPHCPEKTCFMRDAEGKNHWDEQTGFCVKCKAHMFSKGWNL